MTNNGKIPVKKILRNLMILIFIGIVTFLIAGSPGWWNGWIFYGMTITYGLISGWVFKRKHPDLIKERLEDHENIKPWDRIIMKLFLILALIALILAALDFRFGWSHIMPILVATGIAGNIISSSLGLRATSENRFFSSHIRIQNDRGHKVCNTGPYRYIRHPGYLSAIIMWLSFPLMMGSWWTYIPEILLIILFVIRTELEDRTLKKELEGYRDYTEKTPFKLIPGIW